MKRTLTVVLSALAALSLLAGSALAAPPDHANVNRTLAQVRAATAAYHDVESALAAGYGPVSPCVPGMGYHYARGGPAAGQEHLDPTSPEMLVYAPLPNGRLKLVAVEYASEEAATLFGQDFDPPAPPGMGPDFYTLHAWVWANNPDGMFAAYNPKITSCPAGDPGH